MILLRMIDVENEITEEWCKPPEGIQLHYLTFIICIGYSQDLDTDSEFANIKFGMNAIDRLIASLNQEIVLPILSMMVQ